MDGYAVRAADTPATLAIVAHARRAAHGCRTCGRPDDRGDTGGVVPEGADAVVPIENVVQTANSIEIAAAAPKRCACRAGRVATSRPATWSSPRVPGRGGRSAHSPLPVSRGELACGGPRGRWFAGSHHRYRAAEPGEIARPRRDLRIERAMLAALLAGAGALVETRPPVEDDERTPTRGDRARTCSGVGRGRPPPVSRWGRTDLVRRDRGGARSSRRFSGVSGDAARETALLRCVRPLARLREYSAGTRFRRSSRRCSSSVRRSWRSRVPRRPGPLGSRDVARPA